jgi:hypothetical protein
MQPQTHPLCFLTWALVDCSNSGRSVGRAVCPGCGRDVDYEDSGDKYRIEEHSNPPASHSQWIFVGVLRVDLAWI